jgi:hypothetical protein
MRLSTIQRHRLPALSMKDDRTSIDILDGDHAMERPAFDLFAKDPFSLGFATAKGDQRLGVPMAMVGATTKSVVIRDRALNAHLERRGHPLHSIGQVVST